MARLPRLVVPHYPHHILQIGNDHQRIFRDEEDHITFLGWMREAARQFKVAVHAYILLPDRFHLLVSPSDAKGLGRMMQWVGRHYVPYFNAKYQRSGTLWQGRYKATVLEPENYFLLCSRYVELGAVRASLATTPADYRWSSYAHHAGGSPDPMLTDHPLYWALGNTPFDREAAYKALLEPGLSANESSMLDVAFTKGWPLGSDEFKAQLAKEVERRVSPAKPGRPVKLPINNSL